ncbi:MULTISPECIES: nuclear transport factor 2 family protein [unclassified Rathayibacter]|uniref:nuclear transport factor 2 family protein n=1 Tax=unclassified Rathayibacter TaxID=2609250 RepID=UPI000F4CB51A|nr:MULTISPECIES: nuclear transport factor 2 family protein [unclassified Rathayibacter]MCJ1705508.1 nuclear transport factor 2 family protein [Rathayibacter sp. VKM Ac-2926]ROP50187.1 SnoaL-like protein [Rathayibacter sp. PhB186]ROS53145.1 SnoaL-like protein [Rathayibacter sp. PhB185]TCL83661.1 SnoaL-like protein [Rathayibacter sp. PhB192]TCM29254.1 SnoaL-like protein [Rathayibacter sp. PhB179]
MTDPAPAMDPASDTEIRNLVARFGLACTKHDTPAFRALWAEEGTWRIGEPFAQEATGPDACVEMLDRLWQGNDYFLQFTTQGPIDIDGDEAHSESLCQEFARGPERYYRTNGIWTDRLVRRDGRWLFAERSYRCLWLDLSPFSGDVFPLQGD